MAGPIARRQVWLLSGLTAVALVLRLPMLGRSVWFDEACMSDQRLGTFAQLVATLYVDIHPPLYVTFMHFWNATFGDSEVSMRIPPLLCGLASIPLTFLVGRRFVSDPAALFAAALLALSPVHIWYSDEARLYAPMLLSALLAVGTFHRVLDGAAPRRVWGLHAANVAVMLALHYYLAVYVLLLACLAPLWTRGFGRATRRVLVIHGVGLFLLGLFVLGKRALGEFETSQAYMRDLTLGELYRLFFAWSWTGDTLAAAGSDLPLGLGRIAWDVFQGIGVVVTILGLARIVRERRSRRAGPLLVAYALVVPGFLLLLPLLGFEGAYIERSALASLPFFFLIAGAGLASLRLGVARGAGVAVVFALAGASTAALFAFGDRWTVYKPHPDWRTAAAWLGAQIDAGAAGRPVFTTMPNPRSLSYYDARIQDVKSMSPAGRSEDIERKVASGLGAAVGRYAGAVFREFEAQKKQLLDGAALRVYGVGDGTLASLDLAARRKDDVVYFVRNHWHPPGDRTIQTLLRDPHLRVVEERVFQGVSIYATRIVE